MKSAQLRSKLKDLACGLPRRTGDFLIDLVFTLGDNLAHRRYSDAFTNRWKTDTAYRTAVYRLRRAGLITRRRGRGRTPVLQLTNEGQSRVSLALQPEAQWNRKWKGLWYLLAYDVPEKERGYRDALRGFLARKRMGCLQRSLWISPDDIREEYADLVEAAAVSDFAGLLEVSSVIGMDNNTLVWRSWPFEDIYREQFAYCRKWESQLDAIAAAPPEQLGRIAQDELVEYLHSMRRDPLLPKAVCPRGYYGRKAYDVHCEVAQLVRSRL